MASQSTSSNDDDNEYSPLLFDDDEKTSELEFDYVTESWLETASEDELRSTAKKNGIHA